MLVMLALLCTLLITALVMIVLQKKQPTTTLHEVQAKIVEKLSDQQLTSQRYATEQLHLLQDSLQKGRIETNQTLKEVIRELTQATENKLKEISFQVEKRLHDGFEKTTATFTDIVKRLALIDEAQKKITELSTNVMSLQNLLADKRSRGAFGEVQLTGLIRNLLPETNFAFQHTLSNDKRADCVLFLPEPTGNVVIDAKFPLETYQRLAETHLTESERKILEQQFRQDIKHHINTIAEKYIIPNETADGAIMFLPAEAIFADIHAHYPDLVDYSHLKRVWLVSPTTLMAILTTARAVLKDDATRKQVHLIQEHLRVLAKDFERFQQRMENLQGYIERAHTEVDDVNKSARKITSRFGKIEKVELESGATLEKIE